MTADTLAAAPPTALTLAERLSCTEGGAGGECAAAVARRVAATGATFPASDTCSHDTPCVRGFQKYTRPFASTALCHSPVLAPTAVLPAVLMLAKRAGGAGAAASGAGGAEAGGSSGNADAAGTACAAGTGCASGGCSHDTLCVRGFQKYTRPFVSTALCHSLPEAEGGADGGGPETRRGECTSGNADWTAGTGATARSCSTGDGGGAAGAGADTDAGAGAGAGVGTLGAIAGDRPRGAVHEVCCVRAFQ